jgi:TolB-like protein
MGIVHNVLYAQEASTLDEALKNSSGYLVGRVPAGSKVVILNFQSNYIALTNYIIDELTTYLVNDGTATVVDRQNLELLRQEMNFQLSGEVSDESAQAIGRKLGAQTIISGSIAPLGDVYRLRVRAIEVETAAIQGIQNENVLLDATLAALTNTKYKGPGLSASPKPEKASIPREPWKDKRWYLGGSIGGLDALAIKAEAYMQVARNFAFGLHAGILPVERYDYRNDYYTTSLPFVALLAELTFRPGIMEIDIFAGLDLDLAYYVLDLMYGIDIGVKLGPGILYGELSPPGGLRSMGIGLGYRIGLVDRN